MDLVADSLFLQEEQREDVQKMAALGYSPKDIAIYLGVDIDDFVLDSKTPGSTVHFLIQQGVLVTRAIPDMKLHELAEGGNIQALQQLDKLQQKRSFETLIEQMDEDEL